MIRLDKFLCEMEIGSRSHVKDMIKKGMVSVDGEVIKKADFKFDDRDDYSYDLICQALKQEFDGKIVVTLEDKGCVYEINDHFKKVPGIKCDALDTTGAGDIFHGAFTYGIAKKFPLEDTLKFANIVAGLSVTRLGSKNSMFTLEEIKEKMSERK